MNSDYLRRGEAAGGASCLSIRRLLRTKKHLACLQCSSVLKHWSSIGRLNFGPQREHQLAANGLYCTSMHGIPPPE